MLATGRGQLRRRHGRLSVFVVEYASPLGVLGGVSIAGWSQPYSTSHLLGGDAVEYYRSPKKQNAGAVSAPAF